MAKFVAGNPGCKELEVGGAIYKKGADGKFDVPDGHASRMARKSDFFTASSALSGGFPTRADNYCPECGFNAIFSTCGRCGTEIPKSVDA